MRDATMNIVRLDEYYSLSAISTAFEKVVGRRVFYDKAFLFIV